MAALLGGCSGGGGDTGSSTLRLAVADAPVDGAVEVVVKFSGVELKPQSGEAYSIDFDSPQQVDLLATAGGQAYVLIDEEGLPVGDYNWIRLKVIADADTFDSYIVMEDGNRYPLYVPSGDESGLKLNNPFSIPQSGVRSVVVDFDLAHSVVKPEGQDAYKLKPVLRVVDADAVGAVSGAVSADLLDDEGCAANPATGDGVAVYLYAGATAPTGDLGSADAPLAASGLSLDADSGSLTYFLAWLPVGSYTLAVSCQAVNDDPEADDAIEFVWVENGIAVTAGQTTTVNLPGTN